MSDVKLDTLEQKASYGLGMQMGQQLSKNGLSDIDLDAMAAGVSAGYLGTQPALSLEEIQKAMAEMNDRMQKAHMEKAKEQAAEGEAFLAENAKRDGVVVLESGLQYEIITSGEGGDKPTAESTVRTHYHGTFITGDVFDSSYERGQPAEFPVNGVISGWTEALQLMSPGDKWKLYIPYNLAYGENGAPGAIPPFSALVFDVELLEILG